MVASSNAFITALLGVPPKARAEIITVVSITILFLLSVCLPPDGFHGFLNIIDSQS